MFQFFPNIARQIYLALTLLAALAFTALASPSAHAIGFTPYASVPATTQSNITPTAVVLNDKQYVFTVNCKWGQPCLLQRVQWLSVVWF